MADLVPDPLPDAKTWKREIFLQIDALLNPPDKGQKEESAWAQAWSYRYGQWGRKRPDYAAYVDLLVTVAFVFLALELTSYNAYALKFQQWFRTKILRRPQLDIQSVAWEELIYRVQASNQASLQHQEVYAVKPFGSVTRWEKMYGQGTVQLIVNLKEVLVVMLVLYVLWFVIKYWKFVVGVIAGSFFIMLNYFIKLGMAIVISLLPSFVRKFLRLKPKFPDFVKTVREIRNKHINWWIQMKMLGYLQKIYIIKEKTWGSWKRTLLEEPVRNIQSWYQRFHKVHVDLSYLDFLRIVVALYPVYAQNTETHAYLKEHGAKAANQRFFTTVSKALHWSRKKRERKGQAKGPERVPEWWRYLPIVGMYLLLLVLFVSSVALWVAGKLIEVPASWRRLRRAT